jgi:hypothetical protein
MVLVLVVGTIAVAPTAEMATVAIPAKTILTIGGCQLLPKLCRMTIHHFLFPLRPRCIGSLPVNRLFPVTRRCNPRMANQKGSDLRVYFALAVNININSTSVCKCGKYHDHLFCELARLSDRGFIFALTRT